MMWPLDSTKLVSCLGELSLREEIQANFHSLVLLLLLHLEDTGVIDPPILFER